jgi:hypothetical protein
MAIFVFETKLSFLLPLIMTIVSFDKTKETKSLRFLLSLFYHDTALPKKFTCVASDVIVGDHDNFRIVVSACVGACHTTVDLSVGV